MSRAAPLLFVLALAAGCFPPDEPIEPETPDAAVAVRDGGFPDLGEGPQVVIQNYTFAPEELFVSPGDTIRFTNLDGDAHTVTTMTDPGTFEFGQVNGVWFDYPPFIGTLTFKVPETAPHGTVVYYFDRISRERMKNEPRITIR